jgi:phage terminase large subunit GpA-like protein
VIFDEVDGYPSSVPATKAIRSNSPNGAPSTTGTARSSQARHRLIAGTSRIDEMYEAGDRRRYYVPCPHCKHMDYLKWSGESGDASGHVMRFPDGPASAHFECSSCHGKIEESSKREIIERGEWRADNPSGAHRSYHLWAAISYSPNTTWAHIATDFLAAKSDPLKLKTFVNTTLGETWQERGEAPEWDRLYRRREPYAIGSVPAGPIVLTAGVDVQVDRFVYEVVGWAANKESWSIEAGELYGVTALDATWKQLDDLLMRAFIGHDGAAHTISRLAIDSGAYTQTVYNWARQKPMSRVIATKGMAGTRMLVGLPSPVEITVNGKKLKRGYKIWPVGVDAAKAELYGWLQLNIEDGEIPPGYCHFPEHGEDYFKQLTAEHLVTVINKRTRRTQMEWQVQANRQNHMLDVRILARVAAATLGIDRLRPGDRAAAAATPAPASTPAPVAPAPSSPPAVEPPGETGRPSGFWNRPRAGGLFGRRR